MGTINPIVEYDHDEGIAVIGGFVYRGSAYPDLQGLYVFGDFNGRLFYINGEGTISEFQDVDMLDHGAVLGFAQDSQGELYVLANESGQPSGDSGNIYKMTLVANQAPIANAGAEQVVSEGAAVSLDASMSSDSDGDDIQFEWSQVAGPSVSLSNKMSSTSSFTAPSVNTTTILTFSLMVNDGHLSAMSG